MLCHHVVWGDSPRFTLSASHFIENFSCNFSVMLYFLTLYQIWIMMTCYKAFREKIYKARNMNLLLVCQ